jgi:hypothetical protein
MKPLSTPKFLSHLPKYGELPVLLQSVTFSRRRWNGTHEKGIV